MGLLALLLGGCWWPMPGQGPNRQAHNWAEEAIGPLTVGSFRKAWEATVDDGPVGDPVTSTAGVHVADRTHVYAFRADSGSRRWAHGVEAPLQVAQPFVRGNQVLVGQWNPTATEETDPSASDETVALDAATGAAAGEVGPGVLLGERDGRGLLWEVSFTRLGMGQYPFWYQQLTVRDLDTGSRVCCDRAFSTEGRADGTPLPPPALMTLGTEWILQSGHGINDPASFPFAGFGNGIRGYSVTTLRTCPVSSIYLCPTWAVPLAGTTATSVVLSDDQSVAYVGTEEGIYAVDVATATVLWSDEDLGAVSAPPALADGVLYVPLGTGSLVALDAATGGLRSWFIGDHRQAITEQPVMANGVLFAVSDGGDVWAFHAGCGGAVCNELWSHDLDSEITGAPAVSNGQLYVGTADGRLVAFGLGDG